MSTTEERPDPQVVWALINSHVVSRCIHVIADFGVADALDSEPASAEELAERTGMNADALARMVRSRRARSRIVVAENREIVIHDTCSAMSDSFSGLRGGLVVMVDVSRFSFWTT